MTTGLKKKKIDLITSWDDGSILDLKVAEVLEKYKLPGIFYIVCDWVGKQGYLSWDQIKDLDKRGFEIGSHTLSHPTDLKMTYEDQLFAEVHISKDILENVLGHSIKSFCYPRGRADERIKEMVVEAGYLNARGTGKPGITTITDKMYLPGTLHIFQRPEYHERPLISYARDVFTKLNQEGGYCNIWGHSHEIDRESLWQVLDVVLNDASFLLSGKWGDKVL